MRDTLSGETLEVGARAVVNAAGPWIDEVRRLEDARAGTSVTLSRGAHIVLERDGGWDAALTIPIDRHRVAFAVPWAGMLLLGTTEGPFEGDARRIEPTDAEERQILDEAGLALEPGRLGAVRGRFVGVRVLPAGATDTARAHRETTLSIGPLGMVSIAGGKLTTYRRIALVVLHALRAELGLHRIDRRPRPLPGAADPDVAVDALRRRHPELDARARVAPGGHVRRARRRGGRRRPARAARRRRRGGRGAGAVRARARVGVERGGRSPASHDARGHRTRLGRGAPTSRGAARVVILAIDQGTTGTTCLVVDDELRVRGRGYREFPQHYPQPGWVEHDPEELWDSVLGAAEDAVRAAGVRPSELEAIGITNQRETTILWQRATGRPVAPAIVWQDRRTAERCRELPADLLRARTGLVPDPYFSATKLEWLLARSDVPRAELAFGTVDSWLVWKLTGGRVHATDLTNASRTMLLDLDTLDWSDELLDLFGVDRALLPRLVALLRDRRRGAICSASRCRSRGSPATSRRRSSGTAASSAARRRRPTAPAASCSRTPAPSVARRRPGSSRRWPPRAATRSRARSSRAAPRSSGCGTGSASSPTPRRARGWRSSVESTGGVSFVPAFAGLGSPHWNAEARGLISGITRGTTRAQLVRAALEGIAFQVADVLDLLPDGVDVLRADGGASANGFLMQFQADLLGCPVEVAAEQQTTALGAAALAGRAVGVWPDDDAIRRRLRRGAVYEPSADRAGVAARRAEWRRALDRALL